MQWSETGEPPDGYAFAILSMSNATVPVFKSVGTCESPAIEALLLWMYQYFVHRVPGNEVLVNEGLGFIVHEAHTHNDPFWNAAVKVFDVENQDEQVILFVKENR